VDDISELSWLFGYKPEASLVHVSGWCLDTVGGRVALSRCSASPTQRLRPLPDRIELEGTSDCLAAGQQSPTPLLEVAACAPSPTRALELRRTRWSAPGHCVAPRALPVVPGTPLETTTCAEVGDASQTWSFETMAIVEGRPQVRIRFAAQDYCVAAPQPFNGIGDVPTLQPCDSTDTLFELGPRGGVWLLTGPPASETQGRYCLDWLGQDSVLSFDISCEHPFLLTGPVETADGWALEADPDNPSGGVSLSQLGPSELPSLGQVFDVPL
jgi:hypothetical protein